MILLIASSVNTLILCLLIGVHLSFSLIALDEICKLVLRELHNRMILMISLQVKLCLTYRVVSKQLNELHYKTLAHKTEALCEYNRWQQYVCMKICVDKHRQSGI